MQVVAVELILLHYCTIKFLYHIMSPVHSTLFKIECWFANTSDTFPCHVPCVCHGAWFSPLLRRWSPSPMRATALPFATLYETLHFLYCLFVCTRKWSKWLAHYHHRLQSCYCADGICHLPWYVCMHRRQPVHVRFHPWLCQHTLFVSFGTTSFYS